MKYHFTLETAHNPVPYKRTTQKAKFVDKDYHRYQAYKNALVVAFIQKVGKHPHKVLIGTNKWVVDVMVTYKVKRHGDTDNVAKGINDALFLNDKYVAGSYDYQYGVIGCVEVTIIDGELKIKGSL